MVRIAEGKNFFRVKKKIWSIEKYEKQFKGLFYTFTAAVIFMCVFVFLGIVEFIFFELQFGVKLLVAALSKNTDLLFVLMTCRETKQQLKFFLIWYCYQNSIQNKI